MAAAFLATVTVFIIGLSFYFGLPALLSLILSSLGQDDEDEQSEVAERGLA